MRLDHASQLAAKILDSMKPFAQRAEIAGSIRRQKEEVKDIEVVAIPNYGQPRDLFGEEPANLLYEWAQQMKREGRIEWIKPGTHEIIPWPLKSEGKYWRGLLVKAQVKLDLFLTTKETWGALYLIRTGSSEFSYRIVNEIAHQAGLRFAGGKLYNKDYAVIPTPEEEDVFKALGIAFIEPKDRK